MDLLHEKLFENEDLTDIFMATTLGSSILRFAKERGAKVGITGGICEPYEQMCDEIFGLIWNWTDVDDDPTVVLLDEYTDITDDEYKSHPYVARMQIDYSKNWLRNNISEGLYILDPGSTIQIVERIITNNVR